MVWKTRANLLVPIAYWLIGYHIAQIGLKIHSQRWLWTSDPLTWLSLVLRITDVPPWPAYKVLEMELSFLYDRQLSKSYLIPTHWRNILRERDQAGVVRLSKNQALRRQKKVDWVWGCQGYVSKQTKKPHQNINKNDSNPPKKIAKH